MLAPKPKADILVKESIDRLIDGFNSRRRSKLRLYWDYYFGRHYFNITNERGEPIYGIGKKRVKVNLCKYVVDESISALFADAPIINSYSQLPDTKQGIEDALQNVWCSKNGKGKLRNLALMGGVTGDCYVKFVFDNNKQTVVPNILDTDWVTPIHADNDIDTLAGVIIDYTVAPSGGKLYRYTEIITADLVRVLRDGKQVTEDKNPYGFLNVVHIKNLEIPNSYVGMSDIENIYTLNDEINYATSDRANALYYHGNPILALVGAGAGELKVGADRTLILPDENSKAEYIKRDIDFTSTDKHIEDIRNQLLRIARLPEEMANTGNISGVALAMLQAPLIKLVSDKQISYGEGIERANEIILKILEAEGVLPTIDDYRTDIEFAPYLPVDEANEAITRKNKVDIYASLVNNGFIAKGTALEAMVKEGLVSVADVAAELAKVAKEKDDEAQSFLPEDFQEGKKVDKGGANAEGDDDNGNGG